MCAELQEHRGSVTSRRCLSEADMASGLPDLGLWNWQTSPAKADGFF
jgi:hypothetical protein